MDTGDEFFHVRITQPDGGGTTFSLSVEQAGQMLNWRRPRFVVNTGVTLENAQRATALAVDAMDNIVEMLTCDVVPLFREASEYGIGLEPIQVSNVLHILKGVVLDTAQAIGEVADAEFATGVPGLAERADRLRYTPTHKRALRNVAARLDLLAGQLHNIDSQAGRRLCRSDLRFILHDIEALGGKLHGALGDTPGDPNCPF